MLVFMIKGGIVQKTEWYLLNLFTHGNFDEKLLLLLLQASEAIFESLSGQK